MTRHTRFPAVLLFVALILIVWPPAARAADPADQGAPDGRHVLKQVIRHWAQIVEPEEGATPQTLVARLKLAESQGLPVEAGSAWADLMFQAPSHARIAVTINGSTITACRDGNELWVDEPAKKFAVIGQNGVPRFSAEPEEKDHTILGPFTLPL